MRIAHILRPAAGGMLTHVNDLLANPTNHAVVAAPPTVLDSIFGNVDATMVAGRVANPLGQLRDGFAVAGFARAHKIDIIHLHGISRLPLAIAAAKVARLPWVVTLHNMVGLPGNHPGTALLRSLVSRSDAIIAVSQAVRESLPHGAQQIDVVHNGIDCDRLASLPARDQARKLLGWDAQSTVVLAVARLSAEKGIDLLAPLANRSNVRVVVAGDGPLRGKLETMNIEFLGARNDVPLLMAAADIVVVPSRSEGLGLVAIEAAAAGRPVVATRTGGLPEVVEDQWTGLLVPPDNPEAIVDAVESLRVNPDLCARFGDRARQRAQRCFSRESMWHATDQVYKRILQP